MKPDPAKERTAEQEKLELSQRLRAVESRLSSLENITDFIRQDKDELSHFVPHSKNEHSAQAQSKADDSGNTMQMLQNLMMRTRKDI